MNRCLMIRLCELFYIASYTGINWVCFLLFVYIYFANFFWLGKYCIYCWWTKFLNHTCRSWTNMMVRCKVLRIQVFPLTCQVSHVTVVSSVFIKHSFLGFRCQTIPQKTLIKKKNLISNVTDMIIVQLSKLWILVKFTDTIISKIILLYHKILCCEMLMKPQ